MWGRWAGGPHACEWGNVKRVAVAITDRLGQEACLSVLGMAEQDGVVSRAVGVV
jgi:hypothetical protein